MIFDVTDYFAMLIMYRVVRMKEPPFILPFFLNPTEQPDKPKRGRPRQDLEIPTVNTNFGFAIIPG